MCAAFELKVTAVQTVFLAMCALEELLIRYALARLLHIDANMAMSALNLTSTNTRENVCSKMRHKCNR